MVGAMLCYFKTHAYDDRKIIVNTTSATLAEGDTPSGFLRGSRVTGTG